MSSVYVVCWIFLQTFQTDFCIQANSVDPDQTAAKVSFVQSIVSVTNLLVDKMLIVSRKYSISAKILAYLYMPYLIKF